MKCIFLGNAVPNSFLVDKFDTNYSVADNIAQNCLIEGLYHHYKEDLTVITTSSNFNGSQSDKKVLKKQKVKLDCGTEAIAVGNINFNKITYYLSIMITYTVHLIKAIKIMQKNEKNPILIISNGPHIFTSFPILIAQLFYKTCYIPFLIGSVELPEYKGLFHLVSKLTPKIIKKADATITYVAKSSVDYTSKPYLSILYSLDKKVITISKKNYQKERKIESSPFTIFYSGALTKINGIDKLLKVAIKSAETNSDVVWKVCGNGEYAEDFKKATLKYKNIIYLGVLNNEEVIKLQHDSQLLIALRSVDSYTYEYYSKYAASGKLVEYLLSGTPILTANLENINPDIAMYLNFLKSQKVDDILEKINELRMVPNYKEALCKANEGRQYVLENANNEIQNAKVVQFVEGIYNEKFKVQDK